MSLDTPDSNKDHLPTQDLIDNPTYSDAELIDYDLERFIAAQDSNDIYNQAKQELEEGKKRSHWMWFIFPQLASLGFSPTAKYFGIESLNEAKEYLEHPVLSERLINCAEALLHNADSEIEDILGGIDTEKLCSSMTLFSIANPDEEVFEEVLSVFFDNNQCLQTLNEIQ